MHYLPDATIMSPRAIEIVAAALRVCDQSCCVSVPLKKTTAYFRQKYTHEPSIHAKMPG